QGNNNTYCQDNELTWLDWDLDTDKRTLLQFTAKLVHLRLSQPALRRRKYFQGRSIRGGGVQDVSWLAPNGGEMTDEAWNAGSVRSLGMLLSGTAIEEVDERGQPIVGDTLLVLLNGHHDHVTFTLPPLDAGQRWVSLFDTFDPHARRRLITPGSAYRLQGPSVAMVQLRPTVRHR